MSDLALTQAARSDVRPATRTLQFILNVLCLCVPAFINGAPLVFPDTRAYFMGGHTAVEKFVSLFARQAGNGGDAALAAAAQNARGVRSAFYSLFTYIPTVTASVWLVIILQAAIVAAVLRLAFGLATADRDGWRTTIAIAALSALTTVSWAACNVMPDIFTGVMALAIILTVVYWQGLSRLTASLLFVAISFSMVMHVTNLPIGLGLVAAGLCLKGAWQNRSAYLTVIAALLVGAMAMLAVAVVGFKEWTLAPQSPPFLTARSIQDGPGRLYLQAHCPQIGVLMCNHLDKLDQDTEQLIWAPDGVYSAIPPQERARMRAEDKHLYIAAALEHPWMQIRAATTNAVRQLVTFGVQEYFIPSWSEHTADSMTLHLPEHQGEWATIASGIEYLVVIASLGTIILTYRRLAQAQRRLALLVLATVLLEAAAGAISEPVPRYEARVIWLLPLAALLVRPTEASR